MKCFFFLKEFTIKSGWHTPEVMGTWEARRKEGLFEPTNLRPHWEMKQEPD